MSTGPQHYDRVTQALHWSLATLIIFLIFYHPSTEDASKPADPTLTAVHASLGVVIFLLAAFRLYWRLRFSDIPDAPSVKRWPDAVRRTSHAILYFFMLLAPVSGLIIALSTSLQVTIFGFVTVPQTINDEIVHGYLRSLHGFSADVLLYLGSIHILAALYHHFWLKDRILDRMLK